MSDQYEVVDEEGRVVRRFSKLRLAQSFAHDHNEGRDPGTMEYFVQDTEADADKPVARLALDTRSEGPLVCETCAAQGGDELEGEIEDVLLMSDGTIVCPNCHSDIPAFKPFSDVVISASPLKTRGGGRKGFEIVE